MSETIGHTVSSGNVFADMGLPNAEELFFKSGLAIQIGLSIERRGLSQAQAAARMCLNDEEVLLWRREELSQLPVERLFQCILRLGHSIGVRISPEKVRPEDAGLTLVMA